MNARRYNQIFRFWRLSERYLLVSCLWNKTMQENFLDKRFCAPLYSKDCFNWAPRHEGILGEWRYSSTHSLISALDGGEWSASRPGRFTPSERAPGTHCIRGWVGPRAGLDAVVKRKIPSHYRDSNLPIIQPVAQRYTTELSRLLYSKD
jgi:hypothetical protein